MAVPGTSKHNLGIAVDIKNSTEPKRLQWLAANAVSFGFSWEVVPSEPWHLRYVCGDAKPQRVLDWLASKAV
jgi:LAS superfamily LD-carboxypeptidase LdcB